MAVAGGLFFTSGGLEAVVKVTHAAAAAADHVGLLKKGTAARITIKPLIIYLII